jgi:hypothetical protein
LGRKVERRERKKSDKTGKKVEDCVNGSWARTENVFDFHNTILMARGQLIKPPKMGQLIKFLIFSPQSFPNSKLKINSGNCFYDPELYINDVRMLKKCRYWKLDQLSHWTVVTRRY